MKKIYSLLLVVLIACGGSDSPEVQPDSDACNNLGLNTKIFNGTACEINTATPVVRIVFLRQDGNVGSCTGTVVSDRYVLSAAHCISDGVVGILVLSGPNVDDAEQFPVESFEVHPGYNEDVFPIVNDVVMLRLRERINIAPVPILVNSKVKKDEILSIFGYGRTEVDQNNLEELRSGEMKVTETNSEIIRADFDGVGSNTCFGDSGGPLISNSNGSAALVGVTSFGTRNDCAPGDHSYFSNLQGAEVLDFLANFEGIQYQ